MDELLKRLLLTPGVSGCENQIAQLVSKELSKFGTISRDGIGSVICHIESNSTNSQKKKIMVTAHIDTCGFFVQKIESSGLIKCVTFGYSKTSNHQPVHIVTSKGNISGLMHVIEQNKNQLFSIDVGVNNAEDVAKIGIQIGDPVIFANEPFMLQNSKICSPRLDNRLGVYELLLLAREIKNFKHDVYLVGTVGEEVGLRGAQTTSFIVNPDISFVFDITYAELPILMGKGPVVTLSDKSVIIPPHVRDFIRNFAQKHKLPVQFEVWNIGGTDAGKILVSKGGKPVIPLLTPIKHAHSPYEIGDLEDCPNVVKLTALLIQNIDLLLDSYQIN